ncbi:MAG: 16S rRNA (guanine(527)-N(7))-methyltransferase RsmG [Gammaproteobacteria bacterium]
MQSYSETLRACLAEYLPQAPITLPENALEDFVTYLTLMSRWQKVFNLTAIKTPEAQVTHHIMDALSIIPYLEGQRFIDVGTGAGVPGIVLAIAKPEYQLTLLDSVGKKIQFLQQVKMSLKLNQVELVNSRVEAYHADPLFDGVITRAFSSINDMLAGTKHLCKQDGLFYAMKGQLPQDELAALPTGFEVRATHTLHVPGLDAERHLIVMRGNTSSLPL